MATQKSSLNGTVILSTQSTQIKLIDMEKITNFRSKILLIGHMKLIIWASLPTKTVFGVSDKARLKQVTAATKTS